MQLMGGFSLFLILFFFFCKPAQNNFKNVSWTSDKHQRVIFLKHWLGLGAISEIRSRCKSLATTLHCSGRLLSWSVVRGALEQFSHNHTLDCLQFVCVRELEMCGTVGMESVYHRWTLLRKVMGVVRLVRNLKPMKGF